MMLAFRIVFPQCCMTVSTREAPAFRTPPPFFGEPQSTVTRSLSPSISTSMWPADASSPRRPLIESVSMNISVFLSFQYIDLGAACLTDSDLYGREVSRMTFIPRDAMRLNAFFA